MSNLPTHVVRITLTFDVASTKDGSTRDATELRDRAIRALSDAGVLPAYFEMAHREVKRLDKTQSPVHVVLHPSEHPTP